MLHNQWYNVKKCNPHNKMLCHFNITKFHCLVLGRYNKVRDKGPDDICAYFDLKGNSLC